MTGSEKFLPGNSAEPASFAQTPERELSVVYGYQQGRFRIRLMLLSLRVRIASRVIGRLLLRKGTYFMEDRLYLTNSGCTSTFGLAKADSPNHFTGDPKLHGGSHITQRMQFCGYLSSTQACALWSAGITDRPSCGPGCASDNRFRGGRCLNRSASYDLMQVCRYILIDLKPHLHTDLELEMVPKFSTEYFARYDHQSPAQQ